MAIENRYLASFREMDYGIHGTVQESPIAGADTPDHPAGSRIPGDKVTVTRVKRFSVRAQALCGYPVPAELVGQVVMEEARDDRQEAYVSDGYASQALDFVSVEHAQLYPCRRDRTGQEDDDEAEDDHERGFNGMTMLPLSRRSLGLTPLHLLDSGLHEGDRSAIQVADFVG